MSRHRTQLADVCAALNAQDARYVLFGAIAMQLWGTTRATRDIDILIDAKVDNARRVLAALANIGPGLANIEPGLASIGPGLANERLAEELAEKTVTVIGDSPRVDVFTVVWSIHYPEAAAEAETFEIENVAIPTASIDHLIASKRTGRLQDAADIEVLEEIRRLRGKATHRT